MPSFLFMIKGRHLSVNESHKRQLQWHNDDRHDASSSFLWLQTFKNGTPIALFQGINKM